MTELRYPVVVSENGDVVILHNSDSLRASIEPIDVANDEYDFYDSLGRRLKASVTDDDLVVLETTPGSGVSDTEELARVLDSFLRRAQANGFEPSEELAAQLKADPSITTLIAAVDGLRRPPTKRWRRR